MSDAESKDQYKDTVFLPKTDFPMRGGLPQKEPDILKKWQDMDLYARLREASKGREKFVLHDGPPFANGHIHAGTGLTKVLKDFVNKTHQMLGYDAPYVPGWDCHGLPIEWKVEEQYREKGKNKDEVDPVVFRAECRAFAQKFVDIQSEEFQRLGTIADWRDPYLTMTNEAEGKITREIHKFALNGSLYRGVKPVMWSVVEKTALAEAEIEYKEHKSVTVWVKFPVTNTSDERLKDAFIVIWTTTPWTLPSNRAIAYGEDMEYGLFEIESVAEDSRAKTGDKIVLALSLAEDVKEKARIEDWNQIATLKGKDLAGTFCAHPLNGQGYEFEVPLYAADFVTEDAGTGFVHIAPGHGADDYYLGKEKGLEITDNVSDDGFFRDHVPLFAGEAVYTDKGEMGSGNFAVIKAIDTAENLLAKGSVRHDYPHSWRSKAPVIFRTTPQWFIALDDDNQLRTKALKAIQDTRWVPGSGENRIRAMVEGRPDWCISRQRQWGVPIALFVHKETKEILKDENVLNRIGDIFEKEGADAWWARPAEDFLGSDYNAGDYDQVFDVIDVWFESGSTHAFVLEERPELQWPADVYFEGSDQHRGWFQSSLMEACGTRGRAPYKTVITNGFVLDEKGYKMSKSLGNVVSPQDVCNDMGADIFRLWSATSDYTEDLRIGPEILKSSSDLYRRIRNTLRFLLGALDGFTKSESIEFFNDPSQLPELEQLVLHQLFELDKDIRQNIADFDYPQMITRLHNFCANDLSSFYFDIRKDRLYCDAPDSFERRATRSVMAVIFNGLTAWLAPILSFTAEEAWSYRPEGVFEDVESVHLRTFPDVPAIWENKGLAAQWESVRKARKKVLEAIEPMRANKELGSSLEARPHLSVSKEEKEIFSKLHMADICITSQIDYEEGPEFTVTINKAEGEKCQRCWKILPEVSKNGGLCNRCHDVVEKRKAA